MRTSVVLLVLLGLMSLAAMSVEASCVDCYGNFCGDRTNCCGSNGAKQRDSDVNTEPCDGLDALCKAHDLCVEEFSDDDNPGAGICSCDEIFKSGIAKAKAAIAANPVYDPNDPATFDYQPAMCQVGPDNPDASGCEFECSSQTNIFTLDTALDIVPMRTSCGCVSGSTQGVMVTDVANECPVEHKCIQHVCDHNNEAHYMRLGWFWRRAFHRRNWWWSWLWTIQRPAPPPECDGSLVPAQPPSTQCTITFIGNCVRNVPDACNCNNRDFRCLLQKNIFKGWCRSHVTHLVNCVTTDPRVGVFRSLLASNDFDSIDMSGDSGEKSESTESEIKMVIWLPIMCALAFALLSSIAYQRVRSNQYKKRIELMNQQVSSGRSTGLSIIQGEEMHNINTANDSAPSPVSAQ